ncbi:MAG: large conductance mechanosensitive channel protein MscL [Clostridia bacterium]|nr:large conductance mechanosensitive channel protein MscL [Clostridia bacterium]
MKKFFGEFKTFITRGNVMDMAVGVIIGGAFSAIVTALTNHILMPIINWILLLITGGSGLDAIYTYLKKVEIVEGGETVIDLANSIYIDWGAFITAIINFILIALVLFLIIKTINKVAEANKKLKEGATKGKLSKEDKKELKEKGINLKDKEKVAAYFAEKKAAEDAAKAEAEAKAKAEAEEAQKHTTEGLLEQIKALLEKQGK